MHVIDLRGLLAIAAGSLLWKLVSSVRRLGLTNPVRLQNINIQMQEYQANHGTAHRMPPLRMSNLRDDGWAVLNGAVVKAANTRNLLPFLNHLANEYFAAHGAYASSVRKVFASLMTIERILYSSEMFLSDEEKANFQAAFLRLGRHWQLLRALSAEAHENLWQITPKVHIAQHFPEQANLINPTATQCYSEESLIGVMTKIWQAAARGPYDAVIQRKTLNRYWVGLELRMSVF